MATYDYSDTSVQFQALAQQRKDREERRARTQQAATSLGVNAWKAWSGSQQSSYKGLMGLKDSAGQNLYQQSEGYRKSNPLNKMFTPSGGRVELTGAGKDLESVGGFMETKNPYDLGNANVTDIVGAQSQAASRGTDLKGVTDLADAGPKTFGQDIKGMGSNIKGGVKGLFGLGKGTTPATAGAGAGAGGTTGAGGFGKALGGLGLLAGGYGLHKNWKKMSKGQKAAGVGALGLGAAAMFIPGLQPLSLLAGLGKGLIK